MPTVVGKMTKGAVFPSVVDAQDSGTDVTNFANNLSSADDTVQKALDTIDDMVLGGADAAAIHDDTANEISALTSKATPVDNDILIIEDSAASFVKKKVGFVGITNYLIQEGYVKDVLTKNTDFNATQTQVYIGEAQAGEATSAASWRVKNINFNSEGDATTTWADGDTNFDNIWDNRASLTYL